MNWLIAFMRNIWWSITPAPQWVKDASTHSLIPTSCYMGTCHHPEHQATGATANATDAAYQANNSIEVQDD